MHVLAQHVLNATCGNVVDWSDVAINLQQYMLDLRDITIDLHRLLCNFFANCFIYFIFFLEYS